MCYNQTKHSYDKRKNSYTACFLQGVQNYLALKINQKVYAYYKIIKYKSYLSCWSNSYLYDFEKLESTVLHILEEQICKYYQTSFTLLDTSLKIWFPNCK